MLISWQQIRGYLAGAVAFITCPCHLPIIWPILITLTAGTAFGTWLIHNQLTVGAMMTVMFVIGLILAYRWLLGGQSVVCEPDNSKTTSEKIGLQNERI